MLPFLVDRSPEPQMIDNAFRSEVKITSHQFYDLLFFDLAGFKGIDKD